MVFLKNKNQQLSDFDMNFLCEPTTMVIKKKIKHPSDTKIYMMIRLSATTTTPT